MYMFLHVNIKNDFLNTINLNMTAVINFMNFLTMELLCLPNIVYSKSAYQLIPQLMSQGNICVCIFFNTYIFRLSPTDLTTDISQLQQIIWSVISANDLVLGQLKWCNGQTQGFIITRLYINYTVKSIFSDNHFFC